VLLDRLLARQNPAEAVAHFGVLILFLFGFHKKCPITK
jgi:hypothetical protein